MGAPWSGCSCMGRTKNVTSTYISHWCTMVETNRLPITGTSNAMPLYASRKSQHSLGQHPLSSPLPRPTIPAVTQTMGGTATRLLRSELLRLFALGPSVWPPCWLESLTSCYTCRASCEAYRSSESPCLWKGWSKPCPHV